MSAQYPTSVFNSAGSAAQAPILSANLARVCRNMRKLSAENRWAIAGLLLAQVMVVILYLILVDNIAQVQSKRLAEEQQARERHRCAMMQGRLERDQCLVSMLTVLPQGDEVNGTVLATR